MNKVAVFIVVLAGCLSSGIPQEGPSRHAPDPVVHPAEEPGGSSGDGSTTPPPDWIVWVGAGSPTVSAKNAVLDVNIYVTHQRAPEPFDGEGWIFRLSVNESHRLHDGSVEPPADPDWYRNYTLEGHPNATTAHPTRFELGDLNGARIVLRFDYHNLLPDGRWEAYMNAVRLTDVGNGTYQVRATEYPAAPLVCRTGWGECPWYEEHGRGPPPEG